LLLSASFRSIPPSDWDAFWLVVVGEQLSLQSFSAAALLCDVDEKISVGEVVTSGGVVVQVFSKAFNGPEHIFGEPQICYVA